MKRVRFSVIIMTVVAIGVAVAGLAKTVHPRTGSEEAVVASVVDGDTAQLADGRTVRLSGLDVPQIAHGRAGFKDWPVGEAAKAALEKLIVGRRVTLRFDSGARKDRYGRLLAQVYLDAGQGRESWVQGEMLRLGMARRYPVAGDGALLNRMRADEAAARKAKLGIWAVPFYAVRTPTSVAADVGTFQVVQGTVATASLVKGTEYLNFGANWRTDFTVRIDKAAHRLFAAAGLEPGDWGGRTVEVRGWVTERDGPMIVVSQPAQIDLLDR